MHTETVVVAEVEVAHIVGEPDTNEAWFTIAHITAEWVEMGAHEHLYHLVVAVLTSVHL